MTVHCCAKCRAPLRFLTLDHGDREATCCALRYIVQPEAPELCYVALWYDVCHPEDSLGVLDIRSPEYGVARTQILDRARETEKGIKGLI